MNQAEFLFLKNPNRGRLKQWPKKGERAEIQAISTTGENEIGANLPEDKEI